MNKETGLLWKEVEYCSYMQLSMAFVSSAIRVKITTSDDKLQAYQEKDIEAIYWKKYHLGISLLLPSHNFPIYKQLVGLDNVFSPPNSDILHF